MSENIPETGMGKHGLIEINGRIVTCFESGDGTRKHPYESLGGAELEEALIDGYTAALYRHDKTTFFKFQGGVVSVNADMEANVVSANNQYLSEEAVAEEAARLKKEGCGEMTLEEVEEMKKEFKKHPTKKPNFLDKIFEKIGR
jgi:hypothetical protein